MVNRQLCTARDPNRTPLTFFFRFNKATNAKPMFSPIPFFHIQNDNQLWLEDQKIKTFDCSYIDSVLVNEKGTLIVTTIFVSGRCKQTQHIFSPWKSVITS